MWTQIAGEQAQLQAIDQNPPRWTAAGKKAHAQSEQQVAREEGQDLGSCSAWLATLSELRNQASLPSPAAASFLRSARPLGFCRQPTFRNPLCWLNVGHQMIADQHDRALEVIFSRIRENKEILGNLKIEGTTAR